MGYAGGGTGAMPIGQLALKRAPKAKRARPPAKAKKSRPARPARAKAKRPKRAKAPCKYGPRLANGRCPKKPKDTAEAVRRDLKAGKNPLRGGSATRTAVASAAGQAAQRAVVRTTRQLERKVKDAVKKYGAVAAPLLEALAPVAMVIGAARFADAQFNDARAREIAAVADQYKYTAAAIPNTPGYEAGRAKAFSDLARWLGRRLAEINDKYDKRPLSERPGGGD